MEENFFKWAEHYFKHKDIFSRKLKNIQQKEEESIFEYSDRKELAIIEEKLSEKVIEKINNSSNKFDRVYVICDKTNKNINFTILKWKNLLIKNLTLIFVDLATNTKVLINPFIHNRVISEDNLETGIKTLFLDK